MLFALPLPDHMSNHELINFIETSQLHFILFNKDFNGFELIRFKSKSLTTEWSLWKNKASDFNRKYASHVAHPALVRFTSGTTGKAKGVILSHQTIIDRTESANSVLQLKHEDKILWVLSMAFHFVVSIILYLRYGSTIVISNSFLARNILNDINESGATFLYASPMHIRLLSNDDSESSMQSIKRVISTSTGISRDQCNEFYNRFGVAVSQAYGIIEIGLPVINFNNSTDQPNAIGLASPGFDIKIIDDDGAVLPTDSVGNLVIKGPGMFDGYLSPPTLRDDILQDGYFFTGDLATKNSKGVFKVVGRKKSMINVGGNKVFPEEVEHVLMQLHEIKNCRVSGYLHPLLGECVMAEIQLHQDSISMDSESIRKFCKQHLSSYKIPQKLKVVDELPLTNSGKIVR